MELKKKLQEELAHIDEAVAGALAQKERSLAEAMKKIEMETEKLAQQSSEGENRHTLSAEQRQKLEQIKAALQEKMAVSSEGKKPGYAANSSSTWKRRSRS